MVDGAAAAAHVRIDLTSLLTMSHFFFCLCKKEKKIVKKIILDYFYIDKNSAAIRKD